MLHGSRHFHLFHPLINLSLPEQCLAHSRCSVFAKREIPLDEPGTIILSLNHSARIPSIYNFFPKSLIRHSQIISIKAKCSGTLETNKQQKILPILNLVFACGLKYLRLNIGFFIFIMWTSISCVSPYFEWQFTAVSSNKRMSIYENLPYFLSHFERLLSQWVVRWLFFLSTVIFIFQKCTLTWTKQW